MLARSDMTGTRPLVHVEALAPAAPVGDARQESFNRLAHIAIGKQFQAEILSRMNDGTFLVRIDSAAVRMNLPAGTQVGDTLDLTLVAAQPRPTFLLRQQPGAATASLSATGRMIDSLLHDAQQEGAPTVLTGKTPLVASSAATPSQIAAALRNALTFSGLFYESHVGQWAGGGRTLSDLMREPQAQAGAPAMTNKAPAVAEPVRMAGNPPAPVDAAHALPDPLRDVPAAIDKTGTAGADGLLPAPAMSTEAARMINLQLNALEQQRVLWQGELWPGQPLEWEVSEQTPGNDAEAAVQAWQSVVRFELPSLGTVTATIRLAGGHVQVNVRTATQAAASSLRAHGGLLAGALDAAGSPLDLLTVKQDGAR